MGTPTEYVADQRIFIKDMPDDANMYIGWRNGLKAAILAVAKSGEIAEVSRFLIELDDTTGHQTPGLALPTNNPLFGLDAKIYTALLNSLKGANAEKYTFKMTNTATFGCGRQAIRMLDNQLRLRRREGCDQEHVHGPLHEVQKHGRARRLHHLLPHP